MAAPDPNNRPSGSDRDDSMDVLETLRQVNRELLVAAGANIPATVVDAIESARDDLTRAIRLLSPDLDKKRPAEELPVRDFKAQSETAASGFHDELRGHGPTLGEALGRELPFSRPEEQ